MAVICGVESGAVFLPDVIENGDLLRRKLNNTSANKSQPKSLPRPQHTRDCVAIQWPGPKTLVLETMPVNCARAALVAMPSPSSPTTPSSSFRCPVSEALVSKLLEALLPAGGCANLRYSHADAESFATHWLHGWLRSHRTLRLRQLKQLFTARRRL